MLSAGEAEEGFDMRKKMMLLALAVAWAAMFALPAAAPAQTSHLSATTSFSVAGAGGTLTSATGSSVICTGTSGSGTFSTTTSGSVSLKFSSCKSSGFGCDNTGIVGQIEVTSKFNSIMVSAGTSTGKAGILLTPTGSSILTSSLPSHKIFTEFTCFGLLNIRVFGNGVIGTIEEACNTTSATYRLNFESSSTGVQKDLAWTGVNYDLINDQASHPTTSLDGTATMTFPAARQLHCT
jgi:hypothetical protein